jgi:hypothetical protein
MKDFCIFQPDYSHFSRNLEFSNTPIILSRAQEAVQKGEAFVCSNQSRTSFSSYCDFSITCYERKIHDLSGVET